MCGITGFFSSNQAISTKKYYHSHNLIKHRGPDDEGFAFLSSENKVELAKGDDTIEHFQELVHIKKIEKSSLIFGHRRLAIIDLSAAGHQPFQFQELTLVFNGELYNYKSIREELKKVGYEFQTESDTEVVLKAFHHWREAAFDKFNGFWAVAIYDNKKRSLTLSRDRFGIKPLYFYQKNDIIYFASEMKFILDFCPETQQENREAFQTYIHNNQSSFSVNTFWKEIFELEPAQYATFQNGVLSTKKYWTFKPGLKHRSEKEALEEFTFLFEDSLKLRMQSDVEIGTLLSGGLDSTTIVCSLQKLGFIHKNNFKSFSGVHEVEGYTETNYIKDTIAHTGLDGVFINSDPFKLGDYMEKLNFHIEEPFRSLGCYTQYRIYETIRKETNVRVVLNGNGADELFGGYNEQYHLLLAEYIRNGKLKSFGKEMSFLKKHRPHTFQRVFLIYFMKKVMKAFKSKYSFNEDGFYQVTQTPLREYFKYDDRDSMAFGIEARAPYMDHRLVEFALTLDTKFKIRNSTNKKIMRDYAHSIIPTSVRDRKDKMGFTTPQEVWQKRELSSEFDRIIDTIDKNKLFETSNLSDSYAKYKSKNIGDPFYFWRLYNLYYWCKHWNVNFSNH